MALNILVYIRFVA